MQTTERIYLGDYNSRLDGYWIDILIPSMLPYPDHKQLWDFTLLNGRQPEGTRAKPATEAQIAEYWDAVTMERSTRHIVAWNVTAIDGDDVLPIPSEDANSYNRISGGILAIVNNRLNEQVRRDNEEMGKALKPTSDGGQQAGNKPNEPQEPK